ncbi:hypothetical protein SteCoe_18863 [Stentor coeruleus]|uniref:Uncharacterized protein n=1 Tax=Stentor coeruleus TaxID=5963 RepID=A0A1R2BVI4_9CILI|nr:hypothetical protein SteCoe_18863 [Stentor coeruleus]
MSFRENFGRFLLVTICVLSAISMLKDPKANEKLLKDGYSRSFAHAKDYNLTLPLTPQQLSLCSEEIIYLTSGLLLLGSFFIVFKVRIGSCILISLLSSFCVFIHNPSLYSKDKEIFSQAYQSLLNMGLIAGLLLTCQANTQEKLKVE